MPLGLTRHLQRSGRLAMLPLLALPLALLLWLLARPLLQPLEAALEDRLLRATAQPLVANELALIDIDDASLRALQPQLGDWPYPRSVYALLLDYLRDAGAELVVFDLVLSGTREGDAALARAMALGPPTVLAAAGHQQDTGLLELQPAELAMLRRQAMPAGGAAQPWGALTLPAPALLLSAPPGSLGLITAPLDGDGVLRRLPLWHRFQGQVLPVLPLAALQRQGRPLPDWHRDAQGRVQLRLPSRLDGVLPLSWAHLMQAALGAIDDPEQRRLLRGRTVFIGSSAFFADAVSTPQGRLSGGTLMASAYALLARQQVLAPAGALWSGVLLLLACGPALLGCRAAGPQGRRLAAHSLLALLLMLALAWALVRQALLMPPLLLPLTVLLLALLLAALAQQRWHALTERQLRHEREMADAANQAKTRVLAHVSHEIRTPMNAVLGMAEILARTELSAEQRRYVQVFQQAGQQLFELINDLLDNAKIEAGKLGLAPHAFELAELLGQQIELLRPRAEAQGLWLRLAITPEARGWVWGDAQRVAQILANLVGNAIKFTRQGGVEVHAWRAADGRLALSVQDTGIGIAPEQHERIFQPYAQAHAETAREFGGTGLGLAITRSLVELMGGQISLSSTPGAGSRFELQLDLPPHPAPQHAAAPRHEPGQALAPLRLLLCEDNEVNVLVISAMLQPLGHQIELASDGEQALRMLQQGRYDLVLMDLQMPALDGLEATRRWRACEAAEGRRRTPIIAFTANAFASDVALSLEAGCDAHLSKPIGRQALLQALARWAT
ncbi:CHASE2 domain-containing protein [Paucibacter soli]|uniref:CHASE2 domain-containing protein n=1 Tax=Paucibacter soli TaxID=3133433 RepID=UPI0030B7B33F